MTDDLVKRLRDVAGVIIGAQSQNLEEDYGLAREAADRIEQLETSSEGWKEIADEYFDAIGERNTRIEKLETALEAYSCSCSTADEDDCELGDWANISCGYRARKALEGKDD
jgi:hypothetical protein